MNYRIKIKLPKNKVNQFAKSNYTPINISTLSNEEISSILNNYSNHIAIAKLVKSNLLIVGDNWQWSPAKTTFCAFRIGIQQAGSKACPASSITTV